MIQFALIPLAIIFGIMFFVFWLITLIDAATRKFKEATDKIVWIIVIVFTGIIGSLIYYFMVYSKYKSLKWFWITILVLAVLIVLIAIIGFFISFARVETVLAGEQLIEQTAEAIASQ